jgi:hypothetical protein
MTTGRTQKEMFRAFSLAALAAAYEPAPCTEHAA